MNETFVGLFHKTVEKSAGKTALVQGGEKLSYGELDERSGLIAGRLAAAGIGRGDIVPVILQRGIEAVCAVVGVLKAGAAFCCIDPGYPEARIDFMKKDMKAKLTLDGRWLREEGPSGPQAPAAAGADPAVVVYTSGSTGNPKGVVISHRALSLGLRGNVLGRTEEDVFLSTASFSFIAVAMDLLTPLSLGGTVHIAEERIRKDAGAMAGYIRDFGITAAFISPQMARLVLHKADGALRILITGSEKVRDLYSGKTKIYNTYGASETCGPVTFFEIDRVYPEGAPIGRPYEGSCIVILREDGSKAAAGEEGEICIAGQIADGYLNLPGLTEERFIVNPFALGEEDRILFRTNDLGRFTSDGLLEYVQRKDWMVKIRGYRVEPGEIEAAMARLAPVEQAVVKDFENAAGETALFAVYTAKKPVPSREVLKAVAGFLPDYMLPSFLEQVPAMPINANGKIDRKNIAPPDAARFRSAYEAPRGAVEERICRAFEKILGLDGLGAADDFNLLGGDSLSAAGLKTLLEDLPFSASDILALGTPRKLASLSAGEVLTPGGDRRDWPLTYTERQMAAEQGLKPDSVAYNINLAFAVDGPLDEAKLQRALNALAARHAVLRSFYPVRDGEYRHRVLSEMKIPLVRHSCCLAEAEKKIGELNVPFDLASPPLLRCHLFDTGPQQWVLHFCMHHIIMDGASGDVFIGDLWKLYNGEDLPPVELTYMDWALWQDEHDDTAEGEAFFREMFADGVPENEMPTVPLRPDTLPVADRDVQRYFDAAEVDAAAKKLGVTAFSLLFSVFGIVLGKYCAGEDVVLGAAMSGRTLPQQDGMIGMFVNTLPVRLKPRLDRVAADYIREAAASVRRVKAHQTYPFERLVPMLAPDRNASRSPVFDVIVNYLHEMPAAHAEGLSIRRMPVKGQALAMDLMLEILREGDQLRLVLSYSRELYMDEVAVNMMTQYLTTLRRIVSGGERERIMDAAELPEEQRIGILEDFAGERSDECLGETVVDLLRKQVALTPENRAVVFNGEHISYRRLDCLTDSLAAALAAEGAGRGSVVGVLVSRGFMMPVGSLGALKAGAAYLPLDPAYPADRLEFMLEDAGVRTVIADRGLEEKIPGFQGKILYSDTVSNLPEAQALPGPSPEDLLILLYTSGTTGKPKGVMLTHGGLVNFIAWYSGLHGIKETDNIPAYASFGFDACMMDMYPTLTRGACLHIISEEMRLDLAGLNRYFNENHMDVAFMTTQLGRQFAESMDNRSLRALSVGGETLVPLPPPQNYALYNVYGPTECMILSNYFRVDKLYSRVPIGRAVNNTALYVTDSRGRLSPVGVAGELCISGRQVALGYLNRPDLTEEKFVKNPFSEDPDYARMYRSGDVVRWLPSGDIDFVGRRDFQVKIRGFRVELTEIEGRIRRYPAIADAAVIAQDDAGGGKRVVAYIVSDEAVDIKALNAFIEQELPAYMVPAATMQIERIPLNQNGKVNRRQLPQIYIQAEEIVPPRTELEKEILDVVAGVAGCTDLGVTTDLLYAGLNSLSSIKAAALISEKTGKSLTAMDLMREKTAERIAALLQKSSAAGKTVYEKRRLYPLTANQLGLYFACIKEPGTLMYNIPFILSAAGGIDAAKLRQAVLDVVEAHSYVKTHLVMEGSDPMQVRADDLEIDVPVRECSGEEYEELRKHFVRPFNFFEGPLFRMEICRTPGKVRLLCDFHHMIFDGGSMDIFLRDLSAAYGGHAPASEKFTSFDLALAEKEAEAGPVYARAAAYFADRLGDGEGATAIPKDRESQREAAPRTVSASLKKSALDPALRGLGVTPSNLFLASVAFVAGRFASVRQSRIASITNGRDDVRLQNNMGMLVRTLPAVIDLTPELSAAAYLKSVQQTMFDTLENQAYPYMRVSSEYHYHAELLYAYQGGVVSDYTLGDSSLEMEVMELDRVKFPISVNIQEKGNSYVTEVEYDDACFRRETMETFALCVIHTAQQLVGNQDAAVGRLSIAAPAQLARIAGFNGDIQWNAPETLHSLFEGCAARTPDAPALAAVDADLTYRQLNERANRLANALLERGVRREDRIAFLLPRDSRIPVAMLGIMKAGCAYIPVDPDYPDDRIAHILSDSGAGMILTDGSRAMETGVAVDELLAHENTENPGVRAFRDNLCYIIYTSGSTGKPKGVMLTHGNIVNYVLDHPRNRHIRVLKEHGCSMVSVTTVSFDMFLKEAFTTLGNGLRLILADDEASKNPDRLAELFARTGGDAFNATPSRMLQYMELAEIRGALARCKVVMAGGEGYPPALYRKLREITGAVLVNTYGPTETAVSCNGKILSDDRITVGAPLFNVLEQVMDLDGNPLPVGVTGELWIGGTGVARGYYGNAAMTAERFVEKDGVRYYKSGDLARWTDDGEIVILGRNDGQIKLRGLRIELGEIENAVAGYEGVSRCVVAVRVLHGQEHLCAYYTAEKPIRPEALREFLLKSLTKYMVPTAYLQMDCLPVTPNGKTDLKALPEARLMQKEEYEPPRNETEKAYCEIFASTLHMDRVGALDNFFDLGGTSLLVTQVTIDALNRGLRISYSDVFANPTPRELALLAAETAGEKTAAGGMDDYDYSAIHALLAENTLDALRAGEMRPLGNICLTGATGFLGVHVLREFLREEKGIAYCVVRGGRMSAETRLKSMLVYYFSDSYDELFGSRIVVVDGDITQPSLYEKLEALPVDTYVNCAANVKHFSAGTDIEDINVGGVRLGIGFCMKKGCRFVQISTGSVAGMSVDAVPSEDVRMDERMLYFGQDLSNKYVNSKFLAERIALEAALGGLDVKIMRVGNLMARAEDGEFQANFNTNNFLGRLRAYHIIGCIPYGDMGASTEFAPIDYTARAVLKLAQTPGACRVFHPYNDHSLFMGDVIRVLGQRDIEILPCELEEYGKAYGEAFRNQEKARYLNSLIAYDSHGKRVVPVSTVNAYTSQALLRQGFYWPVTGDEYLSNFFEMVKGLGFFDVAETLREEVRRSADV